MFRRIIAFLFLVWIIGFVWFAIALPRPLDDGRSDAAAVLTGGPGRVERGLEALRRGWTKRLLVSGVDREVRPGEFAAGYHVSPQRMECCITLGFRSYDTRSNAREVADWVKRNRFRSVRLITTDWHMRRAALEIGRLLPRGVTVLRDAVPSEPSLRNLFLEYHKFLVRLISPLWEK
jgi:uncharacterized SAM-binding protein YcdF (DUF218 family)